METDPEAFDIRQVVLFPKWIIPALMDVEMVWQIARDYEMDSVAGGTVYVSSSRWYVGRIPKIGMSSVTRQLPPWSSGFFRAKVADAFDNIMSRFFLFSPDSFGAKRAPLQWK